jgi:hypothetical protein
LEHGDSFDCDDGSPLWNNCTFTTPDDWELVRVKVIMPNTEEFRLYLRGKWSMIEWIGNTPEQCSQFVCNWIKFRPDLFEWVEVME